MAQRVIEFLPVQKCVLARITAKLNTYDSQMMNTLSFSTNATPTLADCTAVAAIVKDWVLAEYADLVSNQITFLNVTVESREEQFGPSVTVPINQVGGAGSLAPGGVELAPLALLHSAQRGRSNTGRMYAFAPTASAVGVAGFDTGYLSGLQTAMYALITDSTAGATPLAVGSATLNRALAVVGVSTSPRLTVQTRRRVNFGR